MTPSEIAAAMVKRRNELMTPEERSESARNAARARWSKKPKTRKSKKSS